MAKDVEPVNAPVTVGYSDDAFEWETVHVEQADQITFDTIGDTLIALYLGQEKIEFDNSKGEPQSFTQLKFMLPGNVPSVVNAGYDLVQAFKGIPPQSMVRVQYLKDVDVDQASPMKSYRVDSAKPTPAISG
jgi:hypothetical protein